NVVLVDVIEEKVKQINEGKTPIYEEGLEEMLKRNIEEGRIRATTDITDAIKNSEITFISVGTPSREDGSIDLVYIKSAAEDIGKALKEKDSYHVVVVKSTVVPQTTENIVLPIIEEHSGKKAGKDFGVAMNPEFLKEGKAVSDFMNPDRIVIGGIDEKSISTIFELYKNSDCPIIKTNPKTAEMIKYAANAFLATKISFSNEIGNLCKKLGIDSYKVADAIGYDNRIERRFLNSGIGYGGSCFPKDVKAILAKGREEGLQMNLLDSVEKVNQNQPNRILEILKEEMPEIEGKTIAVLGLAFKGDTDDIREAPSIKVVGNLLKNGAKVKAYDPKATENFRKLYENVEYYDSAQDAIKEADACLILTEWKEFGPLTDDDFSSMRNKLIIEGRRILDPNKVHGFEGICW
ncbi:MAG: UDP-glucose/GDP-mannose dehydrogenase family protein, partial [Candidatus Micrarchaeota archaeon]|nr:UDP-glucose/GDP-mannose dehydrogenase family protein [Candidatus Micrarchaeota archaeon]